MAGTGVSSPVGYIPKHTAQHSSVCVYTSNKSYSPITLQNIHQIRAAHQISSTPGIAATPQDLHHLIPTTATGPEP